MTPDLDRRLGPDVRDVRVNRQRPGQLGDQRENLLPLLDGEMRKLARAAEREHAVYARALLELEMRRQAGAIDPAGGVGRNPLGGKNAFRQ